MNNTWSSSILFCSWLLSSLEGGTHNGLSTLIENMTKHSYLSKLVELYPLMVSGLGLGFGPIFSLSLRDFYSRGVTAHGENMHHYYTAHNY